MNRQLRSTTCVEIDSIVKITVLILCLFVSFLHIVVSGTITNHWVELNYQWGGGTNAMYFLC